MSMSLLRRRILWVNGLFLVVAGVFGFTADVLGSAWSIGPWGSHLAGEVLAIGFLEAHGLAILIGLCLLLVAPTDGRLFWHWLALGAHLLMGTANLVFFDSFSAWGQLPMGIITTVAHWLFVIAHVYVLWMVWRQPALIRETRQA